MSRPARPQPRELTVLRTTRLTPNMQRVTFGNAGPENFPREQAGAYIKLLYPETGRERPVMRTYTVRHQYDDHFDVDFVLHDGQSLAATWSTEVQPGDTLMVAGPGPRTLVDENADWYLLAADMTALPALAVNLELLPENAQGHAVIEIIDEADRQELQHPTGVEIHWVVQKDNQQPSQALVDAVKAIPWREGTPGVWAASEFNGMRALRSYFREDRQLDRRSFYLSSYWKRGDTEDKHKVVKKEDADAHD